MHYGPASDLITPIPIRVDRTVLVYNLPFDLTAGEAEKICRVVRAMATPDSTGE